MSKSEIGNEHVKDVPNSPIAESLHKDTPEDIIGPEDDSESPIKPFPDHDAISLPREAVFVILICLAQLLTQSGLAQTVNPFQYVAGTLGATTPGEISWFTAAFSLASGCFILISGSLGDMFGYKRLYVIGFLWYAFWSLMCGISHYAKNVIFFSVCRALQGIGPALVIPNALGLVGTYYPQGFRKNMIMCCFGAVAPGGFVIGSIFSAIFAQFTFWPWYFYVACLVQTAVAVIAFFAIPQNIGVNRGKRQSFDTLGAITGVCGLVLVNFAFNQGPVVGWKTVYVYVLLIVGVMFFAAFFFVERRVQNPLVPSSVLKGDVGFILGCIAAGWSSFGIWIYYTHQFGILIQHNTVIEMAVKFIPAALTGIVAAVVTGFLLEKLPTSIVMLLAMIFFCTGISIMGTRPVGQTYWAQMFTSTIITSCGMDMSFPAGVVILSNFLPREQQGVAASLVNTVLNYSVSIGLGIAGTVEHYVVANGKSELEGIRAAYYTGMGLAGMGVIVGLVFVLEQLILSKRRAKNEEALGSSAKEQQDSKLDA